jgi:hypothetical protein
MLIDEKSQTFTCKNGMEWYWDMLEKVQAYVDDLNEIDEANEIKGWKVIITPQFRRK